MEKRRISWVPGSFDVKYDESPALIEHEFGNKGLGMIVAVCAGAAILLPVIPTVIQMAKGTATGNPVGAIISVFVLLGWPLYWALNQFFQVRSFVIEDGVVHLAFVSILGRKRKWDIDLADYQRIEYGWQGITPLYGPAVESTRGRYFVRLPHKDSKSQIVLYEKESEQMSDERLLIYSDLFNLPLEKLGNK